MTFLFMFMFVCSAIWFKSFTFMDVVSLSILNSKRKILKASLKPYKSILWFRWKVFISQNNRFNFYIHQMHVKGLKTQFKTFDYLNIKIVVCCFQRISKWKITRLKPVVIALWGLRPRLTKLVFILIFVEICL